MEIVVDYKYYTLYIHILFMRIIGKQVKSGISCSFYKTDFKAYKACVTLN